MQKASIKSPLDFNPNIQSSKSAFSSLLGLGVAASLGLVSSVHAAGPPSDEYKLLFEEEFDYGSKAGLEEHWYHRTYSNPGAFWGGFGTKENVQIANEDGISMLKIESTREDRTGDGAKDPIGGGIYSKNTFGHGYYEARLKLFTGNKAKGFHQAFWSAGPGAESKYGTSSDYYKAYRADLRPQRNTTLEIDGLEFDWRGSGGERTFNAFSNFHWWMPRGISDTENWRTDWDSAGFKHPRTGKESTRVLGHLDEDNIDEWLTIGYEWLPGQITYYINGVAARTVSYVDEPGTQDSRFTPSSVKFTGLGNRIWPWVREDFDMPDAGDDAFFRVDYFRFYAKPMVGYNYVGNTGFDTQHNTGLEYPVSWTVDDGLPGTGDSDGVSIVFDSEPNKAYVGDSYKLPARSKTNYLLHEGRNNSPAVTTRMRLNNIPNGTYNLSAWVRRSGKSDAMKLSEMRAWIQGDGEIEKILGTVDINAVGAAESDWAQVSITGIPVTQQEVNVGFITEGDDDAWLHVDDVVLTPAM